MLLPVCCAVCGSTGSALCPGCGSRLTAAPSPRVPSGLDSCAALFAYDEVGRRVVGALKFRNRRAALVRLGRAVAVLAPPDPLDVVTWAPTTTEHRRHRGYDQAELLARCVARQLDLPCLGLLRRGAGPTQTGRPAVERLHGPHFTCRPGVVGMRILLVDDVLTTGATLAAGGRALRSAGAVAVHGLTLAHTPLKVPARYADLGLQRRNSHSGMAHATDGTPGPTDPGRPA